MLTAFLLVFTTLTLPGPIPARSVPISAHVSPAPATKPDEAGVRTALDKLPLYFVENRGQLDQRVAYYVQGRDKTIYFTTEGLTFALTQADAPPESAQSSYIMKLDFVGARRNARPRGEQQAEAVFSYFAGKPEEWQTGARSYGRVIYADLWPGIDLVYDGTVNRLKYSFVVKPGADPGQIELAYRGANHVGVNTAGELEVETPAGTLRDEKPVSYQAVEGRQVEVATIYRLSQQKGQYGFAVGNYDRSRELVIDPAVLVYCGYIGGSGFEGSAFESLRIAIDDAGNAYVTGRTASTQTSFPVTVGPDLTHNGGSRDAFVAKVRADGTGLVYCGYIGGSGDDSSSDIAVDGAGNAYIIGTTPSTQASFPVMGGPDVTHNGGQDVFVVKVRADGTGLVYCGYIGGSGGDYGQGIAVDGAGNAYVIGDTDSTEASFPVLVGPDLSYNDPPGDTLGDVFVAKVRTDGTGLTYCGYIGGVDLEFGIGIAVDATANAYVVGRTDSTEATFPVTVGPDLSYNGGLADVFVAKLRADGTGLIYCGYIGGSNTDQGNAIAVDLAGNAYIAGATLSTQASFPVTVGPDLTYNSSSSEDAFVAKLRADGTGLLYCGYIGGTASDSALGVAVDRAGNAYVTGATTSSAESFPVLVGPDLTYNGGSRDAFVAKLRADGTGLLYCGYIGGNDNEYGYDIAVDRAGNAYVSGTTYSKEASFPETVGPDLTHNGGFTDGFVAKVATASLFPTSQSFNPSGGNGSVNVVAEGSWTAISNDTSIVTVTSGHSGTGNGTVTYSVAANPSSDRRSATLTINGDTFTVLQGGNFADVPLGHPFYNEIAKLYARGVTLGCGGGGYCPDALVTREQMAAFIIRALGDSNPPTPAQQRFADVPPTNPFYPHIEQMAIRQITLGCGGGNYCPTANVTREQMAAFMIRALHAPGYVPPPPAVQRFADVPPTNAFYAHIEEMAVRQITLGCGGGNYCPTANVTRGQMAAFLVRAFGL